MDWLNSLESVARLAGKVAMGYFGQPLSVEIKPDGSPVTVADRAAEAAARSWISERFPGDAILGEEGGGQESPNARYRWVIDPIDGTQSFIRGVPLWGSMVGVMTGDAVIAGAVFCPALDEMVVAADSQGCWYNGSRCQVSSIDELSRATILTTDDTFRGHSDRQRNWQALASRVAFTRTWGNCYGYLLLATGRAEAMVDNRLSIWDYAPLVPIVAEAGGVLTGWRGTRSFEGDAIGTNAALADSVRNILLRTTPSTPSPTPPAKSAP